jgi:hypothetical protein
MVMNRYTIHLRGPMDQRVLALLAEYDLDDVPTEVVLHGLAVDEAVLAALRQRALELGLYLDAWPQPTYERVCS